MHNIKDKNNSTIGIIQGNKIKDPDGNIVGWVKEHSIHDQNDQVLGWINQEKDSIGGNALLTLLKK
jgi:hypothetical protein